jgi:hypothetical protein
LEQSDQPPPSLWLAGKVVCWRTLCRHAFTAFKRGYWKQVAALERSDKVARPPKQIEG